MHSEDLLGCGFSFDGRANCFSLRAALFCDDVGECGVVEYSCRGISHVQEHLVQCAVLSIPCDQNPQLICVPEWREWPVHHTNDLAESDLGRVAPQSISARYCLARFPRPGHASIRPRSAQEILRAGHFQKLYPGL